MVVREGGGEATKKNLSMLKNKTSSANTLKSFLPDFDLLLPLISKTKQAVKAVVQEDPQEGARMPTYNHDGDTGYYSSE